MTSSKSGLRQLLGEMDTRRKAYVVLGKVKDFSVEGQVGKEMEPDPGFHIEHSIFSLMDDPETRKAIQENMSWKPVWAAGAMAQYEKAYSTIPRSPPMLAALMNFLRDDCSFKLEHHDGSFFDHLHFCRDYAIRHYPAESPTPLFIHSIMGVGTNIFPMEKEKIPKLQALLTPDEYAHVEAFPSMLRLLNGFYLLEALGEAKAAGRLDKVTGVTFHRVIDNEPITLDARLLWAHLNFHLIHGLDFLPVADWPKNYANNQFQAFLRLRKFLEEVGHLEAHVDVDLTGFEALGQTVTLGEVIAGTGPMMEENREGFREFTIERSGKIGHSLDFALEYATVAAGSRL